MLLIYEERVSQNEPNNPDVYVIRSLSLVSTGLDPRAIQQARISKMSTVRVNVKILSLIQHRGSQVLGSH